MTTLKKGQRVQIYHDPITQKDPEGEAVLVKFDSDFRLAEQWAVRFPGETETVYRLIAKQDD